MNGPGIARAAAKRTAAEASTSATTTFVARRAVRLSIRQGWQPGSPSARTARMRADL